MTAWSLEGHLKVGECTSPVRTRLYNIFNKQKNGPHAGAWGSSNDKAATCGGRYVILFGLGHFIVGVVSWALLRCRSAVLKFVFLLLYSRLIL